jgi:hypothetical protein
MGILDTSEESYIVNSPLGEFIFTKPRWFIVVEKYYSHCICVCVHTYRGRGATEKGMQKGLQEEYLVPFVEEGQLLHLTEAQQTGRMPLPLVKESKDLIVHVNSTIDFSRSYTVEFNNVKVHTVGRIRTQERSLLQQYFRNAVSKKPLSGVEQVESESRD